MNNPSRARNYKHSNLYIAQEPAPCKAQVPRLHVGFKFNKLFCVNKAPTYLRVFHTPAVTTSSFMDTGQPIQCQLHPAEGGYCCYMLNRVSRHSREARMFDSSEILTYCNSMVVLFCQDPSVDGSCFTFTARQAACSPQHGVRSRQVISERSFIVGNPWSICEEHAHKSPRSSATTKAFSFLIESIYGLPVPTGLLQAPFHSVPNILHNRIRLMRRLTILVDACLDQN